MSMLNEHEKCGRMTFSRSLRYEEFSVWSLRCSACMYIVNGSGLFCVFDSNRISFTSVNAKMLMNTNDTAPDDIT